MNITSHDDISEFHREVSGYEFCHEFYFDTPCGQEETDDDEQEFFDTAALDVLERHLGFRFDEDDWYMFDWRDDQTLWIRYNKPYEARRLPL